MTSNPTILSSLGLPPSTKDTPKVKKRMSAPRLRKAKSSSSVGSPGPNPEVDKTYSVEGNQFTIVASPLSSPIIGLPSPSFSLRGQSMDMSRPPNSRQSTGPARPMSMSLFGPSSSSSCIPSTSKSGGKGLGINMGEQPESFILWLGSYKGTDLRLEVGRCKKMRMLLRHESTTWVAAFLEMGGYKLVLARLQDVLDMEWR
jgi:hypothetical protein